MKFIKKITVATAPRAPRTIEVAPGCRFTYSRDYAVREAALRTLDELSRRNAHRHWLYVLAEHEPARYWLE